MNRKMYDLTAPQKSIWLTEQYFTNSNINNICGTAIVSKLLDFDLLKKAINNVIEMNDIFNLHFIEDNGNLKQYFEKLESKPIEIIELDSKDDISALEQKLLSKVYNINEDLYDFKIFRVNNAEICGYMLNIHHIKSDAFTLGLCCKKIMQEYIALSTNQPSEKNEKATYENYINSEFEYLNSKKYEYKADKRAVDYLVNAGYNPLAMIVSLNKIAPQLRYDSGSSHPLVTKRMAEIYEYIYTKYPQYLVQNEYKDNIYYQNFLVTSKQNREKLENKIKTNSKKKVKYQ